MTPALSTCWNARRHKNGCDMVEEILALGFQQIELSHGMPAPVLEGVLEARRKHRLSISSVHNFLPSPVEIRVDDPDCYEFTSHRPSDRERAVRLTCRTIDWAEKLEAPFVVVHCGRIRSLALTDNLREMVAGGQFLSRAYVDKKLDAVRKRERIDEIYVQRVLECLTEVVDYAGTKGIRIGIENREYYEAVPTERELVTFLRRLDSAHVGYWHDFGHAQIKHNLGLMDHRQWLETAAPLALGCHVHDVKWPFRDHCAPFTGEIDFETLLPLFPKSSVMVFELSPRTPVEDVRAALQQWTHTFA
ncbi:MAG: sugar phosphate isomerase/epimerase [Chthoniobacterales bacterium]|nr:sugar phosphate isomerase/epimerase [Chthoniobacterales bacterium]